MINTDFLKNSEHRKMCLDSKKISSKLSNFSIISLTYATRYLHFYFKNLLQRSIRRNRQYICKGKVEGNCVVDKTHRNQCRACRLRKCMKEGMNKDGEWLSENTTCDALRRTTPQVAETKSEISWYLGRAKKDLSKEPKASLLAYF